MPVPLLIAEACNPEWVSIPLEGWSHSRALQKLTGGHLVTQIRNRDAILRAGLRENIDFTAIDSEAIAARAYKIASLLRGGKGKGWTTTTAISSIAYPYFEQLIWERFGRDIAAGKYNIVHRITPTSPTTPSKLATLCRRAGVPFVIGPLNGGVPWPKGFDSARRKEKEWLSYLRNAYKLLPGYQTTRRDAAAILIGSRDTFEQMPASFHHKCFYIPENAIDPERFTARRNRSATLPIRAIFVGRLVPYKGPDMLVEAAAPLIKAGRLTLDIIGDGPLMPELKRLTALHSIEQAVTLGGWVPHDQLQHRLAAADVFTFPSVREFGGAVVLEAMAVGVVPIVINYGGPGELVTDKTGFLLPIGSRAQIIQNLRAALDRLANQPGLIDSRSGPARQRASHQFTWDAKAKDVKSVYDWLTGNHKERPKFALPLPDLSTALDLSADNADNLHVKGSIEQKVAG